VDELPDLDLTRAVQHARAAQDSTAVDDGGAAAWLEARERVRNTCKTVARTAQDAKVPGVHAPITKMGRRSFWSGRFGKETVTGSLFVGYDMEWSGGGYPTATRWELRIHPEAPPMWVKHVHNDGSWARVEFPDPPAGPTSRVTGPEQYMHPGSASSATFTPWEEIPVSEQISSYEGSVSGALARFLVQHGLD